MNLKTYVYNNINNNKFISINIILHSTKLKKNTMEKGITEVMTTYRMLPRRNIFNICNLITVLMMAITSIIFF